MNSRRVTTTIVRSRRLMSYRPDEPRKPREREQYPTRLTVRTVSVGRHFYYRAPQIEIRNSIRLFGRRIDVRGEGGTVVAPPSVHQDTQQMYVWEPELREYHWEAIPYLQPAWLPAKSPPDHEVPNTRRGRIQNCFIVIAAFPCS